KISVLFFLVFSFSFSIAQTRTITGNVKDENGEPLIGATVAVKNFTVSTSTDASGNFRISVPQNAETLVVSFIGKGTMEVSVKDRNQVDVTLFTNLKS